MEQTKQPHPVLNVYDGLFNTVSGEVVSLHQPTPEMIFIDDIAHALGNICRFGGQVKRFYSVAQHCLVVAAMAPDNIKMEALLHDASEAYLGDVIKPLKVILGHVYTDIEDKFMCAITSRFGLETKHMELIKPLDNLALEVEFEYMHKGDRASWQRMMDKIGLTAEIMTPYRAQQAFLNTFYKLLKERNNGEHKTQS